MRPCLGRNHWNVSQTITVSLHGFCVGAVSIVGVWGSFGCMLGLRVRHTPERKTDRMTKKNTEKRRTFAEWKAECKALAKKRGLKFGVGVFGDGPMSPLPGARALYEEGETPAEFVSNEAYEGRAVSKSRPVPRYTVTASDRRGGR